MEEEFSHIIDQLSNMFWLKKTWIFKRTVLIPKITLHIECNVLLGDDCLQMFTRMIIDSKKVWLLTVLKCSQGWYWKHCPEYDSSEWNTFSPSAELFAYAQDIWRGRNKRGWVPWWWSWWCSWSWWLFIQRWYSQGQSSDNREIYTVVLVGKCKEENYTNNTQDEGGWRR